MCHTLHTAVSFISSKGSKASTMTPEPQKPKGEMPGATVLRLVEMVNYQEGAVVSRTLVKRATGTITLFAFGEGQGLSEHTTPFDALAQVLEGQAEISISSNPLVTTAGETVLLPANQPHALKAITPFKMLLTMI